MKWPLLGILVASVVVGDLLQSYEMSAAGRKTGELQGLSSVLKLLAGRWRLILGVVCMAISFFAFLALVQTEPISFVVPASAGSFVLETFLARLLLKEKITGRRTAGVMLVLSGILLVAK